MIKHKLAIIGLCLVSASAAQAQSYHYVRPYYRTDGTYVQGHYQTNPDNNLYNNYGTRGNIDPYTGRTGRIDPYQGLHTMPFNQRNERLRFNSGDPDFDAIFNQ